MKKPQLGDVENRIIEREKLAHKLQETLDQFIKLYHEFVKEDLKTYQMLNKPDCLWGDSPMYQAFTTEWVRQYLVKHDIHWGYVLDGKDTIQSFVDRTVDSSKWALRFTKEAEPEKKGLEAIL